MESSCKKNFVFFKVIDLHCFVIKKAIAFMKFNKLVPEMCRISKMY